MGNVCAVNCFEVMEKQRKRKKKEMGQLDRRWKRSGRKQKRTVRSIVCVGRLHLEHEEFLSCGERFEGLGKE